MNARRVFDRVHGEIELPPLAAAITTTPEFCRLDGVRQLGGCAFVFPSATHTRREHSIGVCHLAGRMARHLQYQRPDLVDEDDILCVQLAGLLHDLGHGPFSHLFEEYIHRSADPHWSHEDMALTMLDAMLEANPQLDPESHFRLPWTLNLAFVRLLIVGLEPHRPWPGVEVLGRTEHKRFLLEIVHNCTSGVDVDKLDYLSRDSQAVFGARAFDVTRILHAGRIVPHDGRLVLAYDESVALNLSELYAMRARLHRQVYQHRAVAVVEAMVADLMGALDACLPHGQRLVDAVRDPQRFLLLTDAAVIHRAYAFDPILEPARETWRALGRRPWLTRVPVTVCIRTLPGCATCGAATGFGGRLLRRLREHHAGPQRPAVRRRRLRAPRLRPDQRGGHRGAAARAPAARRARAHHRRALRHLGDRRGPARPEVAHLRPAAPPRLLQPRRPGPAHAPRVLFRAGRAARAQRAVLPAGGRDRGGGDGRERRLCRVGGRGRGGDRAGVVMHPLRFHEVP